MFCRSGIINYGNLHDIDFICTKTLCQGGDCCDFRFVKHRRGEVWERAKSIKSWKRTFGTGAALGAAGTSRDRY